MRDFRKYDVWHLSHQLVLDIYKVSKNFPKEEIFNVTSQLRRACVSIPTNISEGCGRNSDKEFAQFLNIALGSISETEYLIILSADLNFLNKELAENLLKNINQIKSKIFSLKQRINPQ